MTITNRNSLTPKRPKQSRARSSESGAALATAILMLALLSAIAMTVLAVVRSETRIAGSDLKRTQTFYAAAAGIEKMTSDFSKLFSTTSRPTTAQLNRIAALPPDGLLAEGYTLDQTLAQDTATLTLMRTTQGISAPSFPNVVMGADSPFAGLNASVNPFTLTTTATANDGTQVGLTRQMNNYLIPIFQFGVFSDNDLEFWPYPPMTFNGRVHANGNIYFGGDITFLKRVTTASEAVRDKLRNNAVNNTLVGGVYGSNPRFKINSTTTVNLTQGSVINGPNLPQPRADGRGNFPGSPDGTNNASWQSYSVIPFGGLLLSKSTGVLPLKLPLQLQEINKLPMELIKRSMPEDTLSGLQALNSSRYQTKAKIRILIDDENAGNGAANAAGIGNDPVTGLQKGVPLSSFNPIPLDSGRALRIVGDNGTYLSAVDWWQGDPALARSAQTVRGVRNDYNVAILAATSNATTLGSNATSANLTANQANVLIPKTPNGAIIPTGAGVKGRILIEIVPPPNADGSPRDPIDVTREILSMGMTVGEPNGIVYLQRPQWAAFMQGGRDRNGDSTHHNFLLHFLDNSVSNRRALGDGELRNDVAFNSAGFIYSVDNVMDDDGTHTSTVPFLPAAASMARDDKPGTGLNKIVPINVYNVREGRIDEALNQNDLYQRGITSVIDINMRNLARWVDGVYDTTLLAGTNAVSTNIDGNDGYVVYISDRRGDRVKSERTSAGSIIQTTNGFVDNEDVYGYNQVDGATPDPGEDVIEEGYDPATSRNKKGSLQIDKCELPSVPVALPTPAVTKPPGASGVNSTKYYAGAMVTNWLPTTPISMSTPCTDLYAASNQYWFRRAVRVFNGENLQVTGATDKLSSTKGISVATENMIYVWGNYNTTGINAAPVYGVSSLNESAAASHYNGSQVPASIVADAFFPISKTWYDALPAMYPEGDIARIADAGATSDINAISIGLETSVRAGIIAGSTQSAMVGSAAPSYYLKWLNGGVHNFPRFLETWTYGTREERWNYVGSFIMLYNSQQAVGPYSVGGNVVYTPPWRNWAFDITFSDPNRLPPGTPQFQHIEPTGFRQIL